MDHRRWLGIAAFIVAGCAAAPGTQASPPATGEPVPSAAAAAATPDSSGLVPRPEMPALVDGELHACLPLCRSGFANDIPLPEGRYQTQNFAGGYLTADFDPGWTVREDSSGEFSVARTDDTEYGIGVALDTYEVSDLKRIDLVPNTAAATIAWLRQNPDLVVSDAHEASIGSLPATWVDVRLAEGAPMEDPGCGAPCVNFIGFDQWTDVDGIRGDDVYRFYWSDITYGGTPHKLSVKIEGQDAEHLATLVSAFEPVLETITIPAKAAP